MLVELTREQRAVVACDAHALAVHAGAGTGKTVTLAHRVARFAPRGDAHAQARTLVVTFTRDATASLQRKLSLLLGRDHLVRVLSFHQWAARELPREERRFLEESEQRKILVRLLRSSTDHATLARALGDDPVGRAASILGFAKNREVSAADAVTRGPYATLARFADALAALEAAYEEQKGDRLDYDDVPVALRDRLRASPRERARVAGAIDHLFVDEYQDVNGVQDETVRLVATAGRCSPRVTIVGDPRQSIYAFRGGSPAHLARFHELFARPRSARVLALTRNFRATRRLIDAANLVEPGTFPMRAPSGARAGVEPKLVECRDGGEEARRAADEAERLLARDVDAREVAFLCRARFLAQPLVDELRRREGLERVVVSTIHAAKGLEWDHVWLVGAREGGLPGEPALRAHDATVAAELLAEERRLFYVALTRARRTFTASWAGRPSRFVAALAPQHAAMSASPCCALYPRRATPKSSSIVRSSE